MQYFIFLEKRKMTSNGLPTLILNLNPIATRQDPKIFLISKNTFKESQQIAAQPLS
jgi:hypothetical protein